MVEQRPTCLIVKDQVDKVFIFKEPQELQNALAVGESPVDPQFILEVLQLLLRI